MKSLVVSLVVLIFSPHLSFAEKVVIDADHSSIEFSVKHLGIFPVKGRFAKFEGHADYDAKENKVSNIYIKIDTDSVNTDNEDRDAHLRSKDFFHVRNDVYEIVPKNRYIEFWAPFYSLKKKVSILKGKLKILKTKKTIKLKIKVKSMKNQKKITRAGIEIYGKINRKHFGLTWQKPTTGLKERIAGKFVGEEVKLIANLVFLPFKKKPIKKKPKKNKK